MFICGWCGNPTESNPCATCGRNPLEFWDHVRRDLQTAPAASQGTPGVHPDLAAHETLGLAATDDLVAYALDADLANHEDDATAHGLANVVLTDDARLSDARTPTTHSHPESDVTSLTGDLTAKADATHTHAEADVTDLAGDLSTKAASDHAHDAAYAALDHSHNGAQPYGVDDLYITLKNHADAAAVASHHGYGTWARFGTGRFLLFSDTAAETQAGAATHSHSFTQPDAHGALSHAGATVADHAALAHSAHAGATVGNHAFTQPSGHSNHVVTQPGDHPAHTHTSASSTATPKLVTGNTSTGVSVVTGNPSATLTHTTTAVDAHSAHAGGGVDAHSVGQASAHSDHGTQAHTVGQANQHGSQSHANGAVADGSTAPLSITAFAWKRTA